MKALLCGLCFDIRGLAPNLAPVTCSCGNVSARWEDIAAGTVKVRARSRSHARIIGMHNRFLQAAFATASAPGNLYWRVLHDQIEESSEGYIFAAEKRACWAAIFEVGETSDVSWEAEEGAAAVEAGPSVGLKPPRIDEKTYG